jgi:hypothetical protein
LRSSQALGGPRKQSSFRCFPEDLPRMSPVFLGAPDLSFAAASWLPSSGDVQRGRQNRTDRRLVFEKTPPAARRKPEESATDLRFGGHPGKAQDFAMGLSMDSYLLVI